MKKLCLIMLLTLIPQISACELKYDSPQEDLKIVVKSPDYSTARVENYLNFVRTSLRKTEPFSMWKVDYYTGENCNLSHQDVEIEIVNLPKGIAGYNYPGYDWYPGNIQIKKKNKKALMHELGGALGLKHSTDKRNFMYWSIGKGRYYSEEQIKQMEQFIA